MLFISIFRDSLASGTPSTPPCTPSEGGFIPDAPIQFDMISPQDEQKAFKPPKEGPPTYVTVS